MYIFFVGVLEIERSEVVLCGALGDIREDGTYKLSQIR